MTWEVQPDRGHGVTVAQPPHFASNFNPTLCKHSEREVRSAITGVGSGTVIYGLVVELADTIRLRRIEVNPRTGSNPVQTITHI